MKKSTVAAVLDGEWLTLAETVRTLGRSQSTVERLSATGQLRSKLEPRPGRKPERLYSEEDARRLASRIGEANTRSIQVARPKPEAQIPISPAVVSSLREAMAEWRNPPPISIREKLWLTLDEAAELSGLSAGFLRESIVEPQYHRPGENLIGIRGGSHGTWRIQRASLEAFAG
jgi:hypothetical protein